MKKILEDNSVIILGSTGSVGTQAVDVVSELGLKVRAITAGTNYRLLAEQAEKLNPEILCVSNKEIAERLHEENGGRFEIIWGEQALDNLLENSSADVIIHSIAGLAGLPAAISAAKSGARIAMANKEAIIAAGDIIFKEIKQAGGELIPVDSEHSAIFQCLSGCGRDHPQTVKKLLLTASGGPFVGRSFDEIKNVKPQEALAHPTWQMGRKITIDSATLMNKGFEVIEAVRLFGVRPDQIEVLIHRQSIIHSMVEYIDNSVIAQLAAPDMRSCIRYALTHPSRTNAEYGELDLTTLSGLTFERPDTEAFPLLGAAYQAAAAGGIMPAVLIAADEAAVEAYLSGKISFGEISAAVMKSLEKIENSPTRDIDELIDAVDRAKRLTEEIIEAAF